MDSLQAPGRTWPRRVALTAVSRGGKCVTLVQKGAKMRCVVCVLYGAGLHRYVLWSVFTFRNTSRLYSTLRSVDENL